LISPDADFLFGNLFYAFFLAASFLATLLLDVLSKEEDRAMDINGTNERHQLEVKLLGTEWE